jgi:integrase
MLRGRGPQAGGVGRAPVLPHRDAYPYPGRRGPAVRMPEYSVQRFRGAFALVWREAGKRRRRRLYAEDRAGAEAEARRIWQAGDDTPWTLGRIVTAYIADREGEGIASSQRQRDAWKAMKPFWEGVDPGLIDRPMAQAYAGQRVAAKATVRYELSMLAVALRWAEEKGHIERAPRIWRPEPPERKVRHLTRSQFDRWFEGVKAPHARLYVELALATMARPTAILEAQWPQVDWEKRMLDLNPRGRRQTKKRRPVVALNDDAMAALEQAYAARQSAYIVERGAEPVRSVKKAFQAASARTGIHVTPYMLRHTGAVWAAESGQVSMAELAQFLGHDDSATTEKHYARFTPGHLRKVANAVQRRNK